MRRDLVTRAVRELVPAAVGVAAFAIAMAGAGRAGAALAGVCLVALWLAHRPVRPGNALPVRITVVATVMIAVRDAAGPVVTGLSALLLAVMLVMEPLLWRITRPPFVAARLPATPPWSARLGQNGTVPLAHSGLVAGYGIAAVVAAPGLAAVLGITFLAAIGELGLVLAGWNRWRGRHRAEREALRRALVAHGPRFLVYFSAPPGSEYQLTMWLPQLDRLGEPYVVFLAETENLPAVRGLTTMPLVGAADLDVLDTVLVPGVTTVFYVNNAMKNTHCVRYTNLLHVQLYHGDSDKAVTTNPVNAMYDRLFVAGQAAIDRFAERGVSIPAEKFRIVGRPQVAALAVTRAPVRDVGAPVVLYAPTWVGAYGEQDHCSLPIAETLVRALLERRVTVLLRPHPYTWRHGPSAARLRRVEKMLAEDRSRSGRAHRFGAELSDLGLYEAMNLSHAMICDVSAVASDYLYTAKPFAITDMTGRGPAFVEAMPLARAAYVIDRTGATIEQVLDEMLGADPLAGRRAALRAYYLGDFPVESYGDAFLAEARNALVGRAPAALATSGPRAAP